MNKKLCTFIFLFSLLSVFNLFSVEYYKDLQKGYSGAAGASYRGTKKTISLEWICDATEEYLREEGRYIGIKEKLTNEEYFLIDSALSEYTLKKGEIYQVAVYVVGQTSGLNVIVEITDPKKRYYDYVAFIVRPWY